MIAWVEATSSRESRTTSGDDVGGGGKSVRRHDEPEGCGIVPPKATGWVGALRGHRKRWLQSQHISSHCAKQLQCPPRRPFATPRFCTLHHARLMSDVTDLNLLRWTRRSGHALCSPGSGVASCRSRLIHGSGCADPDFLNSRILNKQRVCVNYGLSGANMHLNRTCAGRGVGVGTMTVSAPL